VERREDGKIEYFNPELKTMAIDILLDRTNRIKPVKAADVRPERQTKGLRRNDNYSGGYTQFPSYGAKQSSYEQTHDQPIIQQPAAKPRARAPQKPAPSTRHTQSVADVEEKQDCQRQTLAPDAGIVRELQQKFSKARLTVRPSSPQEIIRIGVPNILVHSGTVTKSGEGWGTFLGATWNDRFFALTSDNIIRYYKDNKGGTDDLGKIDLTTATRVYRPDPRSKPTEWQIVTPGRTWFLKCQRESEAVEWVEKVQAVITLWQTQRGRRQY